jgi:4'-phosphopantetheinyl transferase
VSPAKSPDSATVRFIDELPGWTRTLPAVLIQTAGPAEERQATLKALVARALALNPELVEIEHGRDRPPVVARPLSAGLYLSVASRGAVAAMAVSRAPVGVDVEAVDGSSEIPWNVLHPEEVANLRQLSGQPRATAFARLWSLKEAYLKSLGVGLKREPSSFRVRFVDGETAEIADPVQPVPIGDARTTWRAEAGVWTAISALVLVRIRH